jgi:hypothetical protein
MEGLDSTLGTPPDKRRIAPLSIVLGVVFVFFCGILIFVFIATKRANPVMLDQQGRPVNSTSQPASGGQH